MPPRLPARLPGCELTFHWKGRAPLGGLALAAVPAHTYSSPGLGRKASRHSGSGEKPKGRNVVMMMKWWVTATQVEFSGGSFLVRPDGKLSEADGRWALLAGMLRASCASRRLARVVSQEYQKKRTEVCVSVCVRGKRVCGLSEGRVGWVRLDPNNGHTPSSHIQR